MKTRITLLTLLAAAACSLATPSEAAGLYFEKFAVKTGSEATCMRFANTTARQLRFGDLHQNPLEVAGQTAGAYVSMTCIGRGNQPAVAVVMGVAGDFATAKAAVRPAADRLRGMVCFDSPC